MIWRIAQNFWGWRLPTYMWRLLRLGLSLTVSRATYGFCTPRFQTSSSTKHALRNTISIVRRGAPVYQLDLSNLEHCMGIEVRLKYCYIMASISSYVAKEYFTLDEYIADAECAPELRDCVLGFNPSQIDFSEANPHPLEWGWYLSAIQRLVRIFTQSSFSGLCIVA